MAIATELLFAAFCVFIGFMLGSTGGRETWTEIWYLATSFVSLLIGGWVAGRTNTTGSSTVHGAVTWGLTTLSTFIIALWMFWGAVGTSLSAIRTTVNPTITATAATPPAVQGEVQHLENQTGSAVNHVPAPASHIAGDAIWVFGIIWSGIFLGCAGSLIGSGFAARRSPGQPASGVAMQPTFRESPPGARAASA